MQSASSVRPAMLVLVGLAVAALWFLTLDMRHLLKSDEGRYAEIAREMFASGDWVTIRYNGLKYFEKPPFHLWMTAIAYELFGVGEWQARLWVAISGALGIGAMSLAARRWFGDRAALLTALVLLATPFWNIGSHFNSLDMGVSAALTCALAALLIAQHPDASNAGQRGWMLAAWAAMAVAVLTKGLIGIVLPGMVLVLYTLATLDVRLWMRIRIVPGMLLLLAITAPWFVLVSQRNPEFLQFFFIHEHWERYTSGVHLRDAPVWYFVPQLLAGFLPWLGLSLGIGRVVRSDPRASRNTNTTAMTMTMATSKPFRPVLFLAIWAASIFLFFSASSSKLPGYILPIFPALAVLAALALERMDAGRWRRQLRGMIAGVLVLLLAATAAWVAGMRGHPLAALVPPFALWIAAGMALMLAGLMIAYRESLTTGKGLTSSMAVAALALFAGTTVAFLGHEHVGRPASGADLVAPIERVLTPDMPIYSVRTLDHTLPFYLRRTMIMVETPDELEFGVEQEPARWKPTLQAFIDAWVSGPRAIAVMSPDTYDRLRERHLTMEPVAADARRVVVSNFKSTPPAP